MPDGMGQSERVGDRARHRNRFLVADARRIVAPDVLFDMPEPSERGHQLPVGTGCTADGDCFDKISTHLLGDGQGRGLRGGGCGQLVTTESPGLPNKRQGVGG